MSYSEVESIAVCLVLFLHLQDRTKILVGLAVHFPDNCRASKSIISNYFCTLLLATRGCTCAGPLCACCSVTNLCFNAWEWGQTVH